MVRAQQGDEEAFDEIVREAGGRLLAVAWRILRDLPAAEDSVQRAFVTAWRELPRLRDPDRLDAWLYRLLVRACAAERHGLARLRLRVADLGADAIIDVGRDAAQGIAERDALERAFGRLSRDERSIIVLRYYEDLPVEAIAEALNIPSGTAKSRLYHARSALRAALDAESRLSVTEEASV